MVTPCSQFDLKSEPSIVVADHRHLVVLYAYVMCWQSVLARGYQATACNVALAFCML